MSIYNVYMIYQRLTNVLDVNQKGHKFASVTQKQEQMILWRFLNVHVRAKFYLTPVLVH